MSTDYLFSLPRFFSRYLHPLLHRLLLPAISRTLESTSIERVFIAADCVRLPLFVSLPMPRCTLHPAPLHSAGFAKRIERSVWNTVLHLLSLGRRSSLAFSPSCPTLSFSSRGAQNSNRAWGQSGKRGHDHIRSNDATLVNDATFRNDSSLATDTVLSDHGLHHGRTTFDCYMVPKNVRFFFLR
jgi:hypothetical protein